MTPGDLGVREGLRKSASYPGHLVELAGLGILAAPTVAEMMGKKVSKKKQHLAEVVGLGTLAAPSALALTRRLLLKKTAAGGGAAIPDTGGGSAVTSGEVERETSAPGVTGRSWAQLDTAERRDRGPRPPRNRGVPEWIRYLTRDQSVFDDPYGGGAVR